MNFVGPLAHRFDAVRFAAGMARAARSVVCIVANGQPRCTAWAVTPRLFVLPAYARFSESEQLTVRGVNSNGELSWKEEPQSCDLLDAGADNRMNIALLQIASPRRLPRLTVAPILPEPGAFLSLLSFSGGRNRLQWSSGRCIEVAGDLVAYDVAAEAGSGGGPVFDQQWRVVGMHMLGSAERNSGLTVSAILQILRSSRHWPEIVRFHRLVEVTDSPGSQTTDKLAAAASVDPGLLSTALATQFDASKLPVRTREALQLQVANPDEKLWTLMPAERNRILRSAGGLDVLRAHLPPRPRTTGDKVIRRIVKGPPYPLSEVAEEELPWWIQAVSWFDGVHSGLPPAAEVRRELEQRRVRSRLASTSGKNFQGRGKELTAMRRWFSSSPPVPLLVTGIGGVGKSALVARFALSRPEDTLTFWLDFDRADLAPDDAASVLDALAEQAAVQLEGWTAPSGGETLTADSLAGAILQARRSGAPPALLVLDSFEAAQYRERYQELWPVLEVLSGRISDLRIIVSGRAEVPELKLNGRAALPLKVDGLAWGDARKWLTSQRIRGESLQRRIWNMPPRGLPLILQLARELVAAGQSVPQLPKTLPPAAVVGFLYDRILDRVHDGSLKPLAKVAIVLRRLTPNLITEVLGSFATLPKGPVEVWFARLGREAGLVEGGSAGVLRLRSEVRASALHFLEQSDKQLVSKIDRAAAEWYALQPDVNQPEIAAELVYHRLRLGDVEGAKLAWRDGCGRFLQYAAESLRARSNERKWLSGRLSPSASGASLESWESDAGERIRMARARRKSSLVREVISERSTRSNDSPLVFHEAFELLEAGEQHAALDLLAKAGPGLSSAVVRDRAILRGLLLDETGAKRKALDELSDLNRAVFRDRKDSEIEWLLSYAGRLHVATDLEAEMQAVTELRRSPLLARHVAPIDAVTADLQTLLSGYSPHSAYFSLEMPTDESALPPFAKLVEEYRFRAVPDEPEALRRLRAQRAGRQAIEAVTGNEALARVLEIGWLRWHIASNELGLRQVALAQASLSGFASVDGALSMAFAYFAHLPGLNLLPEVKVQLPDHRAHPLKVLVNRLAGKVAK
jgi:hypothetical protein